MLFCLNIMGQFNAPLLLFITANTLAWQPLVFVCREKYLWFKVRLIQDGRYKYFFIYSKIFLQVIFSSSPPSLQKVVRDLLNV